MKKIIASLTAVTVLFLVSCGPKLNNPIIGKWKLEDIAAAKVEVTPTTDSGALGGAVDSLAKGMADVANAFTSLGTGLADAFLKGSTYEFKDNGSMSQSVLFGSNDGKYSVTPDNKTVTMTMDGKDEVYTITSVNDKQLVLTTKDNMTWTFSKQ